MTKANRKAEIEAELAEVEEKMFHDWSPALSARLHTLRAERNVLEDDGDPAERQAGPMNDWHPSPTTAGKRSFVIRRDPRAFATKRFTERSRA